MRWPSAASAVDDYVRFLPNDGNNVYAASDLLRSWPAGGPKELWRKQIGEGKSGVVVAGGRAFTATEVEGKQWAVALDPATGNQLWRTLLVPHGNKHQVKGPVMTPVIDGDRAYFIPYHNNNGDIYDLRCPIFCLRVADGSVVWSEGEKFVSTEGSTPLIVGDTLYVASNGKDSVLIAVNKMTGKLLWKVAETEDAGHRAVYGDGSSLTYQVVEGIPQIIVGVYRSDNMGVNAKTGEVLWHWKFPTPFSSGNVSTPVAVGSRLFMSGFQGPSAWGVLFEMKVKDGKTSPSTVYINNKLQTNAYHTVSVIDGAVYGFGRGAENDALQCTDFATGKLLWQQEGPEWSRQSNMTAAADGLLFALNKKDELVLIEVNKTGYKELGRVNPGIKLGIQQQPMIYDGKLYLRGNDTIVCYQIK